MKLVLFLALLLSGTAQASIITAAFGGQIDGAEDYFDPDRQMFVSYGLGIDVDDTFSGSFSYDSETGAPQHFIAEIAGTIYQADQLQIRVRLFDTFLNWFSIRGEIGGGLFMAIGLTAGTPVFVTDPPDALVSDAFVVSGFQINRNGGIPIEVNVNPIGTIRSTDRFWLTTLPEPGSLAMFLAGFVLLTQALVRRALF